MKHGSLNSDDGKSVANVMQLHLPSKMGIRLLRRAVGNEFHGLASAKLLAQELRASLQRLPVVLFGRDATKNLSTCCPMTAMQAQ